MKKNNKIVFPILLLMMISSTINTIAQVETNPPMRQVIGTTGGSGTFPSGTLDYTIGEPMVQTYSNTSPFTIKALTQGFQQPEKNVLNIHLISTNSTCLGANNGTATVQVLTSTGTLHYSWLPWLSDTTASVFNLHPGEYPYSVTDGNFTINDTVIISGNLNICLTDLIFYSGLTPNGDGNNDTWVIDSISLYPLNTVTIFNRWGDKVWQEDSYDNKTVVWTGNNKAGKPLTDGTYFYVVEANLNVYKGWVELTH